MASSSRRKKQNRAKAAAKHAETRRRRAATARIRAVQARLSRIYDPGTSAAELAILLAEHYQGVPVAGWLASALLREGSSLGRLQDAAKVMLSGQDAPSLTAPQDRRQPSSYLGEADRPGNGLRLARRPAGISGWHGCRCRRLGEVLAR
jgi:hypothetical protein